MKKITFLFLTLSIALFTYCSSNDEELAKTTNITINFNHTWEDDFITKEDFTQIKFENENRDRLSIERLRYLISDIHLENESGIEIPLEDYLLIDLGEEKNLTFSTENLLLNGTYNLYFRFGFSDEDNYIEDGYPDLTSEIFNVGENLGGGYHYMQFDGKYTDEDDTITGFNYHAIRATNRLFVENEEDIINTDTSFEVDLGTIEIVDNEVTIEVQMDIAEWFTAPNEWNLNELDTNLMGNFDAQIMMNENGASVFSLVEEEEEEGNL